MGEQEQDKTDKLQAILHTTSQKQAPKQNSGNTHTILVEKIYSVNG